MSSLEKKMYFLPDRLYVKEDSIYVAFNLSVIPKDMEITSMFLHIQLPAFKKPTSICINRLLTTWSESSLSKGKSPKLSKYTRRIRYIPGKPEQMINVTKYKKRWRKRKAANHGVYICFRRKNLTYILTNPPYLIADTL